MNAETYRHHARTCTAQAKRERNPDIRKMLQRNARAYYAMARQEIAA